MANCGDSLMIFQNAIADEEAKCECTIRNFRRDQSASRRRLSPLNEQATVVITEAARRVPRAIKTDVISLLHPNPALSWRRGFDTAVVVCSKKRRRIDLGTTTASWQSSRTAHGVSWRIDSQRSRLRLHIKAEEFLSFNRRHDHLFTSALDTKQETMPKRASKEGIRTKVPESNNMNEKLAHVDLWIVEASCSPGVRDGTCRTSSPSRRHLPPSQPAALVCIEACMVRKAI
ncbi:hypothetical protein Bbelb_306670 [Branchiostoma belcheri]|nr:hypothetical protein Bbelb_306670 [Branchiostoma belcheri]